MSSRLDRLQRDILDAFFARTTAFRLTGGGALVGFYLHHRRTDDLDLFAAPPTSMAEGDRALRSAADALGASVEVKQDGVDFRRFVLARGEERTVVDLVIDRVPRVSDEVVLGGIHLDSLEEIAANKVCTLLSRMEPRDLVDLDRLLGTGIPLARAVGLARQKDGGADPATLAWVLSTWWVPRGTPLPEGTTADGLLALRDALVVQLTAMALPDPGG